MTPVYQRVGTLYVPLLLMLIHDCQPRYLGFCSHLRIQSDQYCRITKYSTSSPPTSISPAYPSATSNHSWRLSQATTLTRHPIDQQTATSVLFRLAPSGSKSQHSTYIARPDLPLKAVLCHHARQLYPAVRPCEESAFHFAA